MSTNEDTISQLHSPSNNFEGDEDRPARARQPSDGDVRPSKRRRVNYAVDHEDDDEDDEEYAASDHGSAQMDNTANDDSEKRRPGRPKGSKNKSRVPRPRTGANENQEGDPESEGESTPMQRGPGRPKGTKNKSRASGASDGANRGQGGDPESEGEPTPGKRAPGRPKGSKNKRRHESTSEEDIELEEGGRSYTGRDPRPVLKRGPGRLAKNMELETESAHRRPKDIEVVKQYLPSIEARPGSKFHRHGVWNEDEKVQLEASWSSSDSCQLDPPKNTDEHPLWRIMVDVFSSVPRDLFTYGLKLRIKDSKTKLKDADSDLELPDLNMGGYFCKLLQRLACHPMWYGDLSRLRYALQLAICTRITNHISPLGPLDVSSLTGQRNSRRTGDQVLTMWSSLGLPSYPDMKQFAEQLSKVVKKSGKTQAKNDSERLLFLVEEKDIVSVSEALDTLQIYGKRKWEKTDAYYEAYRQQRIKRNSHPPTTAQELLDWKKVCFLADKRDALIRSRILSHELELACFDVPEKDVMVAGYFDKSSKVSEDQRSILRGMVNPPNLPDGYRVEEDEFDTWIEPEEVDSSENSSTRRSVTLEGEHENLRDRHFSAGISGGSLVHKEPGGETSGVGETSGGGTGSEQLDGESTGGEKPAGESQTVEELVISKPTGGENASGENASGEHVASEHAGSEHASGESQEDEPHVGEPHDDEHIHVHMDEESGDEVPAENPAGESPVRQMGTGDEPADGDPIGEPDGRSSTGKAAEVQKAAGEPTGTGPTGEGPSGGERSGDESTFPEIVRNDR